MWAQFKKLIHDCLTENNGADYCPFRVAGAAMAGLGIPTFLWNSLFVTYTMHAFDAQSFGIGFGAMMAGLGALAGGVGYKAKTDT